jgi:hypothetical protein
VIDASEADVLVGEVLDPRRGCDRCNHDSSGNLVAST